MQTDRTRILALAADYDTAPTKIARHVKRTALCVAIEVNPDTAPAYIIPSGKRTHNDADHAARLWVAASRRTHPRGRPATNRPHRLHVPATAATRDAIHAHAALTGRTRATVAGDVMEEWAMRNNAKTPKGEGGES